jgi:hypothetical protein
MEHSTAGEIAVRTTGYRILFFMAGSAYLQALGVIHALASKLETARVELTRQA